MLASLPRTELVSIVLIHAAGFTETTSDVVIEDDPPKRISVWTLASWPEVSVE